MNEAQSHLLPFNLDKLGFLVRQYDEDTFEIFETKRVKFTKCNSQEIIILIYNINLHYRNDLMLLVKINNTLLTLNRALFGKIIKSEKIKGFGHLMKDKLLCNTDKPNIFNKIVLVQIGKCSFYEKAINAQKLGVIAIIIYNVYKTEDADIFPLIIPHLPYHEQLDNIYIPVFYMNTKEFNKMRVIFTPNENRIEAIVNHIGYHFICNISFTISVFQVILFTFSPLIPSFQLISFEFDKLRWINFKLIEDLWYVCYVVATINLFFLLPFSYFLTESEGFPGSRK
ncbi:hypothetical protein A3Q56_07487, partial [Intoshia linei]